MHLLAQLLNAATQPLSLVLLFAGAAWFCFRRFPTFARTILGIAVLLLALTGWQPLSNTIAGALEDSYAAPAGDLSEFTGVIVLGGAILGSDGRAHGTILLGDSAERMTESARLLRQYPKFKLLFTGGDASMSATAEPEADQARIFFEAMGIESSRAMYERESVNTYENAVFSAKLAGVTKGDRWLLLTSAMHMRRSMAVFQKAGWNVTAYPVDYITSRRSSWLAYSLNRGAEIWRSWARETLGFAVYAATGRL